MDPCSTARADLRVDVDAMHAPAADLHHVAGNVLALQLAAEPRHPPIVLDDVRAVGVDGQFVQHAPPVHGAHVKILSFRRILLRVLHASVNGGAIVVHPERAHENADEDLRLAQFFPRDVVDGDGPALLAGNDRLVGRGPLDVHDRPVGGADDVIAPRNRPRGISPEPIVTPKQIGRGQQEQDRQPAVLRSRSGFHA